MPQVVIPAAGLGTRFAPYTSLIPKELLAVGNKPAFSYILDECKRGSLDEFVIITSNRKQLIREYISQQTAGSYIVQEQQEPRGLGHAVLCAQTHITGNSFGICLPDDLIFTGSVIAQLQQLSLTYNASVIAVEPVAPEEVSSYGIVSIKDTLTPTLFELADVVEKPAREEAPSNYAIIGRYWLTTHIFSLLEHTRPDHKNEIQLTSALAQLIQQKQRVLAYVLEKDKRYDIGTPSGWLTTNIEYARTYYL